MATQKYSREHVLAAVVESRGLVTFVARRLGCTRGTVRNYAARYPDVAQAMYEERERFVDNAELALIELVEQHGDQRAVRFVLKTIGKDRGYG